MERWIWIALLWCIVAAGLFALRRRSPFHMLTVALLATGLVGSFYPIATAYLEPSSWRNLDALSHDIVLAVQQQYVAFAAGLSLCALTSRSSRSMREDALRPMLSIGGRDFSIATGLLAVGALLYAAYCQRVGAAALFARHDYALKYLAGQGLGPLQLGLPLMMLACLWAEGSALPRATKNAFALVALAVAVWSIAFISVRTNAVLLVLGYAAIHAARRGWELRRVRVSLALVLLGLYVGLEAFALLRGLYRSDLGEALWLLQSQGERAIASAVGGSELAHPFITAGEVLRHREAGELAGASLIDGLAACLPRGLHPDRPLMLSEQFVRANYAELAARGGGAAFSLVAEAWLDFGAWVGPLLFGLAMGALLAWVERRTLAQPDGIVARTAPYFVFYVAMQHRNEFATLFKQVFMLALVVVPLWLAADALARAAWARAWPSRSA
jgi:hypothetical protein